MYHEYFSTRETPQTEPVPGKDMVQGRAGGYIFAVDDWKRLERFLILGSSEPTYYASAKELTVENAQAVVRCMKEDGMEVVSHIVEISEAGRAAKNDAALFALAMCAGMGDAKTKTAALEALPRVARIGTHLFSFLTYVEAFRGWGRGLKNAVAGWYNDKPIDKLSYQVVKYRQRGGWTHRDVLRLAHPKDEERNSLYAWIVGKEHGELPALVQDFERLQAAASEKDVIAILNGNRSLSWEMIPTEHLGSAKVWEALLPNLPMTAMIRNLSRMTMNGLLSPMSSAINVVVDKLTDESALRKARVHPIAVLAALCTYSSGQSGFRLRDAWKSHQARHGDLNVRTWEPVAQIIDALDSVFYLSFGNVEPTGEKIVLALDVSGSMFGAEIAGIPGLDAAKAAAAMALVTARVEPNHVLVAFSTEMIPVPLSPRQRLDDVVAWMDKTPMGGGTDCAMPMLWALGKDTRVSRQGWYRKSAAYKMTGREVVEADAFMILTDSETWHGDIHPFQALQQYRRETGIPAKLVTVGMTSNGFSISDPSDGGMLDCVGFDTATPNVISNFIAS